MATPAAVRQFGKLSSTCAELVYRRVTMASQPWPPCSWHGWSGQRELGISQEVRKYGMGCGSGVACLEGLVRALVGVLGV